jgi:hypothetical protein
MSESSDMLITSSFSLRSYFPVFWFFPGSKICRNTFLSNLARFCSSILVEAQVLHAYSDIERIITLYRVSLDLIETSLDFNIVFNPKKHLLAEFILFCISLWLLLDTFNSTSRYLKFPTNLNSIFLTIKLLYILFFRDSIMYFVFFSFIVKPISLLSSMRNSAILCRSLSDSDSKTMSSAYALVL